MLTIQNEIIKKQLKKVSKVVDSYISGDTRFPYLVINWLKESEDELSKTKLPQGAKLSTMRAKIVASLDYKEGKTRKELNSIQRYESSLALEKIEELLSGIYESNSAELNQYKAKLQEVITAASLLNLIPTKEEINKMGKENGLKYVWENLMSHQNTKPATTYIANSLSMIDRLYLLDELIRNLHEN